MTASTIECSFSLSGRDFDPDECVREVGVGDAEVWRRRREHLRGRLELPNVEVRYGVGPDAFDSLDEPVRLVLAKVAPATDRIVAYAAKRGLGISVVCMVKAYAETPLYVLSAESMRAMAAPGAQFSRDFIDLRADDDT